MVDVDDQDQFMYNSACFVRPSICAGHKYSYLFKNRGF